MTARITSPSCCAGRYEPLPTAERGFSLAVALGVTLPRVRDRGQAARLAAAAHQVCPYRPADTIGSAGPGHRVEAGKYSPTKG
jgi:hypothetical protein